MLNFCRNDQRKWKNKRRTKGASLMWIPLAMHKMHSLVSWCMESFLRNPLWNDNLCLSSKTWSFLMFLQYTIFFRLTSGKKSFRIFSQKFFFNLNFLFNHYEAKLCILCIVSWIHNKDAPFVLLLFFTFFRSFRQIFIMFKDWSLESRNVQTQKSEPIQCTVWSRNDCFKKFSKTVRKSITFLICVSNLSVFNVYLMLGETYFDSLQVRLCWVSASS